jgi:hypothetical protein
MTTPPTPILQTTRSGSRSAVLGLNQSQHVRKGEPKRRMVLAGEDQRIVEPDAKTGSPGKPWTDASLLLVILHYLLKNNTPFMGWNGAGEVVPRSSYNSAISSGGQLE